MIQSVTNPKPNDSEGKLTKSGNSGSDHRRPNSVGSMIRTPALKPNNIPNEYTRMNDNKVLIRQDPMYPARTEEPKKLNDHTEQSENNINAEQR